MYFNKSAIIIETIYIIKDVNNNNSIFCIILLSKLICMELIIIDGKKTVIVKVESLDVQWSSNKLNFLTKYPTKIIINKTATWIKILLKFIKCPPYIYIIYQLHNKI
ncbi:hypothetical protein HMPREF1123_02873 [Clostridioides difficile 050-P50-2011]|nr:hypothetical protein HMPREF1123_02873 [Clostridioides difficile 050-P50-2011]